MIALKWPLKILELAISHQINLPMIKHVRKPRILSIFLVGLHEKGCRFALH